ncbi:MAG TPA: hypothetical protein DCL35_07140 [Candidatus Omnitrophica bacterium]|nr:hypothetical protein [Candidatus Omnitrophota bacterium]
MEEKPAIDMGAGGKGEEHILVIDDNEDVRKMLKDVLERRGFFVTTAVNGEEGLELIAKGDIRIVLSDILMPKINGIEFLDKVREYNLSVEVIMVTGRSSLDTCVESIEKGACAYLIKPVMVNEIFEAVDRARRNIREKQEMIQKILKDKQHG